MNRGYALLAAAMCLPVQACSLHYDEQVSVEDDVPEFVFQNVIFDRYEDSAKKMELAAQALEQYKNNSSAYARGAHFTTWNEEQAPATEGTCDLMGLDSNDDIYTMFGSIAITNYEQKTEILAENLKWNKNTEQLTAGISDRVTLKRSDLVLEGTGFSASGVSKSFSFTNSVAGTIDTEAE